MTDPAPNTDPAAGQGDPDPAQPPATYTPPATQADLDRIIEARVKRTRDQYKDYADLKAKADELDKIQLANQTEAQRQAEELTRWQTQAEQWRTTAVSSRIEALAAQDFADPSDAAAALSDGSKYLDAGGVLDEAAIRADLADLLAKKPHWRKPDGAAPGPRPPAPNPAQGSHGGAPTGDPAQQFAAIVRSQIGGG